MAHDTSTVRSHQSRNRNRRVIKLVISKKKICPTCIWYSEEFMRFFKDASTYVTTKDGKRFKVYKQRNDLKEGKHSLEQFEQTKENFVRHFNDVHVSNNLVNDRSTTPTTAR